MPEVHIIGEITGGTDFASKNLVCKYSMIVGSEDQWKLIEGKSAGQTQLSCGSEEDVILWNHPIDLYYATTSVSGWPKIRIEVWQRDFSERGVLCGYGTCYIPMQPGQHIVECCIWRPEGSLTEKVYNFFLGLTSHLQHEEIVESSEDRFNLSTESVGVVYLNLDILTRGLKNHGVALVSDDAATA